MDIFILKIFTKVFIIKNSTNMNSRKVYSHDRIK